jgi:hypothetical protein
VSCIVRLTRAVIATIATSAVIRIAPRATSGSSAPPITMSMTMMVKNVTAAMIPMTIVPETCIAKVVASVGRK